MELWGNILSYVYAEEDAINFTHTLGIVNLRQGEVLIVPRKDDLIFLEKINEGVAFDLGIRNDGPQFRVLKIKHAHMRVVPFNLDKNNFIRAADIYVYVTPFADDIIEYNKRG